MKISSSLLAGAILAGSLALPAAGDAASGASTAVTPAQTTPVTIRVEGLSRTLVSKSLQVAAAEVDKDGKPADTCKGVTAAAALEQATHGDWSGEYSSGLGYSVTAVKGESHPFSSRYYWSFWLDGHAASTGICGAKLKADDSILLFPQCSARKSSECPSGSYNPSVLELSGPARAKAGAGVGVRVREIANPSGKAAAAAGAKVSCAGHTYVADSHGVAQVRVGKPGTYTVRASAPGSIRDELTLEVR